MAGLINDGMRRFSKTFPHRSRWNLNRVKFEIRKEIRAPYVAVCIRPHQPANSAESLQLLHSAMVAQQVSHLHKTGDWRVDRLVYSPIVTVVKCESHGNVTEATLLILVAHES